MPDWPVLKAWRLGPGQPPQFGPIPPSAPKATYEPPPETTTYIAVDVNALGWDQISEGTKQAWGQSQRLWEPIRITDEPSGPPPHPPEDLLAVVKASERSVRECEGALGEITSAVDFALGVVEEALAQIEKRMECRPGLHEEDCPRCIASKKLRKALHLLREAGDG